MLVGITKNVLDFGVLSELVEFQVLRENSERGFGQIAGDNLLDEVIREFGDSAQCA